jgi:membrane protein implicated in regulation of membrane protease activity
MKCLNWKVIGALVAVAVGVYLFTPGVAAEAGALLVLALCPLSMLLMMRAMGRMGTGQRSESSESSQISERSAP